MTNLEFITPETTTQNKRDLIKAKVDSVDEKYLDEVYNYILNKQEVRDTNPSAKQSLMSKLKTIKIDAPEDFAENFELYLRGEKQIEENIR